MSADRVAVVTGAGSGIGRATALRLAAEQVSVIAADIDALALQATMGLMPEGAHLSAALDVAQAEEVDRLLEMAGDAFGHVDVLVCNAAVSRTPGDGRDEKDALVSQRVRELDETGSSDVFVDQVVHMTDAGWDRMIAVNLSSVFYCCRAALRLMNERSTSGSIVCVSSIAAQSGTGPVHYAAAKAGVIGFVRALALEVAPRGIRVNAVCPGPVDSAMFRAIPVEQRAGIDARVPLGRIGTPDDLAAAICFLASADADFVTGSVLPVNGGLFIG